METGATRPGSPEPDHVTPDAAELPAADLVVAPDLPEGRAGERAPFADRVAAFEAECRAAGLIPAKELADRWDVSKQTIFNRMRADMPVARESPLDGSFWFSFGDCEDWRRKNVLGAWHGGARSRAGRPKGSKNQTRRGGRRGDAEGAAPVFHEVSRPARFTVDGEIEEPAARSRRPEPEEFDGALGGLTSERRREIELKNEQREMQIRKARGELIELADVKRAVAAAVMQAKNRLESMAARLTPKIVGECALLPEQASLVMVLINQQVDEVLDELAREPLVADAVEIKAA